MIRSTASTLIASTAKPVMPPVVDQCKSDLEHPRILVVDDVPGIREILAAVLDRAGYCVTAAEDGEMAWEALRAGSFDLLITDHEMPRLTGTELLRRVRASSTPLPVILISGRIPYEEEDLSDLTRNGTIMAKPLAFNELLDNARNLLAQCRQSAGLGINGGQMLNSFDHQPHEMDESWQDVPGAISPAKRLIGVDWV